MQKKESHLFVSNHVHNVRIFGHSLFSLYSLKHLLEKLTTLYVTVFSCQITCLYCTSFSTSIATAAIIKRSIRLSFVGNGACDLAARNGKGWHE